jgi:uncharacterized protein YjdB
MMVKRRWRSLAWLCLAGSWSALGCADEDAGRFGPDGSELAEYRFEPGPSLRLSTEAVTLSVNETLKLTATQRDPDGVANDVSAEAEWASDDPAIAWVQRGTIVAVFPGITQIDVSHDGLSDRVAVAVTTQGLEAIEVEPSTLELAKGLSASLRALGVFRQGSRRDITGLVQWQSSDPAIAALDGNQLHARALGVASVEASLNDIVGSANVAVTGARLLGLEVIGQRDTMPVGSTQQLRARASFSDQQTIDVTDLAEWTSDEGNLASVDENGLVSARSAGEVGLWARYLGHAAQTSVSISADE